MRRHEVTAAGANGGHVQQVGVAPSGCRWEGVPKR
jgi:hypothetical protein